MREREDIVQEIIEAVLEISRQHKDNEATARPMWWILTPRFGGSFRLIPSMFCGPFWSREAANEYLEARRYRFSDKSVVYCNSANDVPELRKLYDLSKELSGSSSNSRLLALQQELDSIT